MIHYYNENDEQAAEWLRELIKQGTLPYGHVDERSIVDVTPDDLDGFDQCHFFAGIGALAYAVQCAGYGEVSGIWTGSCPCQPFSNSGKQEGIHDERHLWPTWFDLIRVGRPDIVFGEQVAAPLAIGKVKPKAGDEAAWIDHVQRDFEAARYALGVDVSTASSVGAPHIRQRLYFVAHTALGGQQGRTGSRDSEPTGQRRSEPAHGGLNGDMAHTDHQRPQGRHVGRNGADQQPLGETGVDGRLAHANGTIAQLAPGQGTGPDQAQGTGSRGQPDRRDTSGRMADSNGSDKSQAGSIASGQHGFPAPVGGPSGQGSGRSQSEPARRLQRPNTPQTGWDDPDWLFCRDERWRPIESGLEPLVDGFTPGMGPSGDPSVSYCQSTSEGRVMRLRGYGNSIVLPQAITFIEAAMEAINDDI